MRTTPGSSGRNSSLRPVSELKICSIVPLLCQSPRLLETTADFIRCHQREERSELGPMRDTGERGAQRHEQRRLPAAHALPDFTRELSEIRAAIQGRNRGGEESCACGPDTCSRVRIERCQMAESDFCPDLRVR